ncbi:MAG TPA: DUF2179 domain-containing protein [Bacillota bacterium]|nr:DUF2179 domain-containing protein [Clostridiaceae bacterium]HNR04020.1 DUF2179 domain-containing protein [Bacillota bacterium]HNT02882.1 DUF2179 domain-containing protein [Bacillota bacterium]HPX67922.1 DUF2179 domain-containing protein [Bacillota bacterium]HQA65806.1 DUF2179 domain-containing protein [Bacillota bacterium]
MSILIQALLIFFARIIDVSIGTMRTILLVKGQRRIASVLGFFEVMIYLIVLGKVVGNIDKPMLILAYCSGYAAGNIIGSKIEERLSIGRLVVQVIVKEALEELVESLREAGFGVTIIEGEGKEGKSYMLNIILDRKQVKTLYEIVDGCDCGAFITTMDVRSSLGGYFQPKKM